MLFRSLLRPQLRHLGAPFSASASSLLQVPLLHPSYMIWSANTSLGKTLVSTGLAYSFLLYSPSKFLYLKPLQTGFPSDSDSHFVMTKVTSLFCRHCSLDSSVHSLAASNSVLRSSQSAAKSLLRGRFQPQNCENGLCTLEYKDEKRVVGQGNGASKLVCQTLYAWEEAVSPHLAMIREGGAVEDAAVVDMLGKCLKIGLEDDTGSCRERMSVLGVIETAGGVASPGPSGSLQCDLYRHLRLPGILVGDGRLGGISATISAYESLNGRGYDVVAVIFEDHGLANEEPLMTYLRHRVPVLLLPPVPQDPSNNLIQWFDDSQDVFSDLKETMLSAYSARIKRLKSMPEKAANMFWWPFTQHNFVPEERVTVIDSRCGENFAVFKVQDSEFITQQFDACASWWTQGPDAALQTELARVMGYSAARFGHVMFPENVYEPALECAELLLDGVGKGWASRVYFSDNGSTAIEIALKMAFRKFCCEHGFLEILLTNGTTEQRIELMVLALSGSYHGDTLGAMEAQAPSSYTGFLQQPWYTGRGLFLDPPTVFISNSTWNLSLPKGMQQYQEVQDIRSFRSRDEIFDAIRDKSDLAEVYLLHIKQQLLRHSETEGTNYIGALIIEPVIQGAGGMQMVDPLFQRVLVNECRRRKIPVIFDEVFTGFWRLGTETAAELLGCTPDLACFAKLMTGGIIPLAATLATEAVFNSFVGDSKLKALLHGHSYSAHAMGCAAAAVSMKWFGSSKTNPNLSAEGRLLRELWDTELVQQMSSHPHVKRVVALGTLCAIELKADDYNTGYGSVYASTLIDKLREDGVYMRPLGNVVYLMCGPCTCPEVCKKQLIKLYTRVQELFKQADDSKQN